MATNLPKADLRTALNIVAPGRLGGATGNNSQRLGGGGAASSGLSGNQNPYNNGGDDTSWTSNPWGYGGYGGYGGGSGGSGGSGDDGPSKEQARAARALAPIAAYGNQTLLDKAKNAGDVYDINNQAAANSRDYQIANARRQATDEWFPQFLKEQAAASAIRDKMGNAAYGSAYLDWLTDQQRVEDADAVSVLNALSANIANINQEYYDALQQSNNGYNEMAMDTESKLREGFADYASQLVNIHPDIATGEYKGTSENEDEGVDYPQVVDIEGRKLNPVDWLTTEFYNKNKRGPVNYELSDLFRPDAAVQKASTYSTRQDIKRSNSSANQNYWKSMNSMYGNRRA